MNIYDIHVYGLDTAADYGYTDEDVGFICHTKADGGCAKRGCKWHECRHDIHTCKYPHNAYPKFVLSDKGIERIRKKIIPLNSIIVTYRVKGKDYVFPTNYNNLRVWRYHNNTNTQHPHLAELIPQLPYFAELTEPMRKEPEHNENK